MFSYYIPIWMTYIARENKSYKGFYSLVSLLNTMTNSQTSIRATIGKHQRVIMLTVAIVALAAYIVPFAHLYDVADAASKYKDKRNSHDQKNKNPKKDPRSSTSGKISIAQSAVLNSGIFVDPSGSGGSGSGYQGTQTQTGNFFSFINQVAQVCSGTSTCSSTLTVSNNQQYGQFGGPT
jgi:hypothetical protein